MYARPSWLARAIFWQRLEIGYSLLGNLSTGMKVLDFGGGSGTLLPTLARRIGEVSISDSSRNPRRNRPSILLSMDSQAYLHKKNPMPSITGRARKFLGTPIHVPGYVYPLLLILLLAFDLRIQSVIHTEVHTPLRADALEYVLYALNLKFHGVYSQSDTLRAKEQISPMPDAKRAPLYPLFLMPFLDENPSSANINTITRIQAVISTFTVLLVFWTARYFLPVSLALVAAALTAISPHLVTMNVYILSETLFCFFIVLAIFLLAKTSDKPGILMYVLTGLTIGAAALTHPILLYFVIPLAIFLCRRWGWKPGWRKAAAVVLAFCTLYGVWVARNINTLGAPGDNTLMLAALRSGVYTDMMYRNLDLSYGYPYFYDANFKKTSKELSTVLKEVTKEFRSAPFRQMRWYILGKPVTLWSWDNIDGPGDVFIYPVQSTPYQYLPQFKASHALMHGIHGILVVLMAMGVVIAWLPARWSGLTENAMFVARAISLLLLYHVAVMMIGFPLPRYAIPMRPFLYLMSLLPIALVATRIMKMRTHQAVPTDSQAR